MYWMNVYPDHETLALQDGERADQLTIVHSNGLIYEDVRSLEKRREKENRKTYALQHCRRDKKYQQVIKQFEI